MDRETTKKNLTELLRNPSYSVIALSGVWGSGKTHLWRELAKEEGIKHGYLSLFGAKDSAQIKRGLALSLMHLDEQEGQQLKGVWQNLSAPLSKVLDTASGSNGLVGAAAKIVGDLVGDRVVDRMLAGNVVVLDDLERATGALPMESIMGVIDDLRGAACRVIVILSTENLIGAAQAKWQEFYEKTIDVELALQTSCANAIDAVAADLPSKRFANARNAWLETNCRNIRIAQRAARAIKAILGDRTISDDVALELTTDIAVLTVAHHSGLLPGMTAEAFLKAKRTWSFAGSTPNTDPLLKAAREIPIRLSPHSAFQDSIVNFLRTGHSDEVDWERQIGEIEEKYAVDSISRRLTTWISNIYWSPAISTQAMVDEAIELIPHGYLLNLQNAQAFLTGLQRIDAAHLQEEFIAQWCDNVTRNKLNYSTDEAYGSLADLDQRLHNAATLVHDESNPPPSLEVSMERILIKGSWGPSHEASINKASADDWLSLLLQSDSNVGFRMAMKLLAENYDFLAAGRTTLHDVCTQAVENDPIDRLGGVLKLHGFPRKLMGV
ncbi:hypothetical protein UB46_23450 [Burkholderiaceae bacterium 16]|nr:hypothetical protein UB46_23450 [Burkholderiaceae bacterium 16]